MRWQGLLVAIPITGVAITLLELTRLPASALAPDRLLAALAQLLRSAAWSFAIPAALVVATAAVLSNRTHPRVRAGLLGAFGVAQIVCAREVLIEYSAFVWDPATNAALAVLALASAGVHVGLTRPWKGARGAGLALAIASLVIARAHYVVLVGLYPTLHQATLQLCFAGGALGVGMVLASIESPRAPAMRLAVGLAAALVALAFVEVPASAWARPVVTAYTELGRGAGVAEALEREAEHLLPTALPEPRVGVLLDPDEDAEARFALASGLPAIDFALEEHDVLLVMVDAVRFDRTSLADPRQRTTPHLARLERHGAHVFTRAYAPSNGTFPSLASVLSMRPVSFADLDLRSRFWRGALREGRPTAPEILRAAGRETFWIGHDHEHCFSEHADGLERGFDRRVLIEEMRDAPPRDVDREVATEAIRAIESTRGRWFGMVFFLSPHDPYWGGYDAELRRFDAALGRVLAAVDLSRTIVIVASDHGEGFGEHGYAHHLTSVYDEQVHVPLVAWIPGTRGARHDAPTSTAYVFPWLLARGTESERAAAREVLREDVGPLMRELDGAVVSEMIGPRRQEASLAYADTTIVYDVLAGLPRVFDAETDPAQLRDLREDDAARVARVLPLVDRYRRVRFEGRRFRFVGEAPR